MSEKEDAGITENGECAAVTPNTERCQSCGVPLSGELDNRGAEVDESRREEYCSFCYDLGSFTMPELTVEDMIEMSAEHMVMHLGMAPAEAADLAARTIRGLDRWKS